MQLERPYCLCLTLPGAQMQYLEHWRMNHARLHGIPDMDAMVPHIPLVWSSRPAHRHSLLTAKKFAWNRLFTSDPGHCENILGNRQLILSLTGGLAHLRSMRESLVYEESERGNNPIGEPVCAIHLSNPFRSLHPGNLPGNEKPEPLELTAPLLCQYCFHIQTNGITWYLMDEMRVLKER